MTEEKEKISIEELKSKIYNLDWKKILKKAIERRPSSWGYSTDPARPEDMHYPVNEWRNACDELRMEVVNALEGEIEDDWRKLVDSLYGCLGLGSVLGRCSGVCGGIDLNRRSCVNKVW